MLPIFLPNRMNTIWHLHPIQLTTCYWFKNVILLDKSLFDDNSSLFIQLIYYWCWRYFIFFLLFNFYLTYFLHCLWVKSFHLNLLWWLIFFYWRFKSLGWSLSLDRARSVWLSVNLLDISKLFGQVHWIVLVLCNCHWLIILFTEISWLWISFIVLLLFDVLLKQCQCLSSHPDFLLYLIFLVFADIPVKLEKLISIWLNFSLKHFFKSLDKFQSKIALLNWVKKSRIFDLKINHKLKSIISFKKTINITERTSNNGQERWNISIFNTFVNHIHLTSNTKHMSYENKISSPVQSIIRFIKLIHHCWILWWDESFELNTLDVIIKYLSCFRFWYHRHYHLLCVFVFAKHCEHFYSSLKDCVLVYFYIVLVVCHLEIGKNLKFIKLIFRV